MVPEYAATVNFCPSCTSACVGAEADPPSTSYVTLCFTGFHIAVSVMSDVPMVTWLPGWYVLVPSDHPPKEKVSLVPEYAATVNFCPSCTSAWIGAGADPPSTS